MNNENLRFSLLYIPNSLFERRACVRVKFVDRKKRRENIAMREVISIAFQFECVFELFDV